MQEFSVPAAYVLQPDDNITDDVVTNAKNWPDGVGFRAKVSGSWAPVTWREFAAQVRDLAAGFIAAGIKPGDRVALMSRTRYEWTLLDYAILSAGGVTVPIYPTSSREQVEWILGDSGLLPSSLRLMITPARSLPPGPAFRHSPRYGRSTAAGSQA